MKPTWQTDDGSVRLLTGDCRVVLPTLEADSFTACVTDPPYHLTTGKKGGTGPASLNENNPAGRSRVGTGFMGKAWDGGDVAFDPATWRHVYRVLKPGAHLLAFGGTRTYHRMVCAIEDAGFEIRDCIMWLYGSGFPKSLDVSKAIDKAAGAEREDLGVNPNFLGRTRDKRGGRLVGQGEADMEEVCRVTAPATDAARQWQGYGTALKPACEPIVVARKPLGESAIDIVKSVESLMIKNGFQGEIRWTKRPVKTAAKPSLRQNSTSTKQPISLRASSAEYADESVKQNTESETGKNCASEGVSGQPQTQNEKDSTPPEPLKRRNRKQLPLTAEGVCAAENPESSSSPSITSTATGAATARKVDEKSFSTSERTTSQRPSGFSAGTAIALLACTDTALTVLYDNKEHVAQRLPDGSFLWPDSLPTIRPGRPLTVAANVQQYGTGALNIDGCKIEANARPLRVGHSGKEVGTLYEGGFGGSHAAGETSLGRWPANCIHDGSDEVLAGFPQTVSNAGVRPRGESQNCYGAHRDTPYVHNGDSGSAARFFKCCPQDTVCILCDMPYNRHIVTNPANGASPCQLKSNSPVRSAEKSSRTSPATSGRIALGSAAPKEAEQIAHNAKCAASLCDSCAIAFAHALVETRRSASSSEVSQATRDFTGSYRSSSLIRSLVSCAATLESIGTIPTIPSLSKLFGSVLPAIERFIKPESVEVAADDSDRDAATRFKYVAKASRSERGEGNKHPTVKPLALMEYLVKLVSVPEGNRILDPFAGSGTTLLACYNAFHEAVGIDLEADHVDISSGRVANEVEKTPLFKGASA